MNTLPHACLTAALLAALPPAAAQTAAPDERPIARPEPATPSTGPASAAAARDPASTTTVATTAATTQLPPVRVLGRRVDGDYAATDAPGATRTDTPLRETPQSVRVITRALIDDVGATRLEQLYDRSSGIARQNDFGGAWDNYSIRGFSGNEATGPALLRNGLAGNRGISPPRDAANLERVEVLKGPAAALYGSSEPGGMLNLVTKRPRFRPSTVVSATLGSYGTHRLAVDATGPLGNGFAGRLNAAVEERDGFRAFVASRRALVAPALEWRLDADTTLAYDGEFLRQAAPWDRGIVAIAGQIDALPRSRFLGEPADGDVTVSSLTHTLRLERRLDEDWQARVALSSRRGALEGTSTEATSLRPDQRTLWRQRRFRDYASDDQALQAEAIGRLALGGLAHQVVVGLDAYRFGYDTRLLRINPSAGAPYAIDVLAPVYGQTRPTPAPNTDTAERQRGAALYLQDELRLGERWRALAGVRVDRFEQRLENRRNGAETRQSPSSTTPRVGLTYLIDPSWSAYATAGRSFRPNAGTDAASRPFEPERGRAVEAGLKYERTDQGLAGTLAVFDIRKRNVLTGDPANPTSGFSIAAGEVRSRGVELDLAGRLTSNLRLSLGAAWLDAAVTQDNTVPVGTRLANVPRTSANALLIWEDALPDGAGRYGLGGGVDAVGARSGDAGGTFELPGYATVKLLAWWQPVRPLRLSLDVANLFDRRYAASSYSPVWITPGAPRWVTLGAQWRFE